MEADAERVVWVPFGRLVPWRERFDRLHPDSVWTVDSDSPRATENDETAPFATLLRVHSSDGTRARFDAPVGPPGAASFEAVVELLARPWHTGLLLVRRGGYAIGRLDGPTLSGSSVGRRHVQGRTKAGGWSQQRFARRRANQAQVAFDAAAGHAVEILARGGPALAALGVGGDRQALAAILTEPALSRVAAVPQVWLESSGDPNRAALTQAADRLRSLRVTLVDPVG
jgi:hypothetical protein